MSLVWSSPTSQICLLYHCHGTKQISSFTFNPTPNQHELWVSDQLLYMWMLNSSYAGIPWSVCGWLSQTIKLTARQQKRAQLNSWGHWSPSLHHPSLASRTSYKPFPQTRGKGTPSYNTLTQLCHRYYSQIIYMTTRTLAPLVVQVVVQKATLLQERIP